MTSRKPTERYRLKGDSSLGALLNLEEPCEAGIVDGQLHARPVLKNSTWPGIPALPPENLGSADFRRRFGTRLSYMAGAMANGIASEELVLALSRAGILASFGAAGLPRARIQEAIARLKRAAPDGPFAINLIHTPGDPNREMEVVRDCLDGGVEVVEASAFLKLEPSVVYYRAAGLSQDADGAVRSLTRVIAKLSRREVAEPFLRPAPREMLDGLVATGHLTALQARLAESVPVADAVTAEADSGGHTDRQPLGALLPIIMQLRNDLQAQYRFPEPVLVGAAGGLGTPAALAAAFAMGADYVVTGSINQASVEAGTSAKVKELLAAAESTDVAMAPAADMFEMGVQVQVLKKGMLFPMRAQRLGEMYRQFDGLEHLPDAERQSLEKQCFRTDLEQVWNEVQDYLGQRQPMLLAEARLSPKKRMGVVFRWYLGQASKWAIGGQADRVMDFQVWCGPAMGAFNSWVAGSSFAPPAGRGVVRMATALMRGAAFLARLQFLRAAGLSVPAELYSLSPDDFVKTPVEPPNAPSTSPPPVDAPPKSTRVKRSPREIATFLAREIAGHVAVNPLEIDTQQPFESFGLDSVKGMLTLKRLETWLGGELSATLLWNYPTIELLSERLARLD
ncbi:MAG TPA: PfaD family polyunsaturated fatty acid/polyketide biosynthesis protein [Chthoniobacter sp.]|jgi:PfaD family protein